MSEINIEELRKIVEEAIDAKPLPQPNADGTTTYNSEYLNPWAKYKATFNPELIGKMLNELENLRTQRKLFIEQIEELEDEKQKFIELMMKEKAWSAQCADEIIKAKEKIDFQQDAIASWGLEYGRLSLFSDKKSELIRDTENMNLQLQYEIRDLLRALKFIRKWFVGWEDTLQDINADDRPRIEELDDIIDGKPIPEDWE